MTLEALDSFVVMNDGYNFVRRWNMDGVALSPIVLLHDSLGSVEQWRDFPAALAEATGRSVVAYDRLGFGKSSQRSSPPTIDFIREEAEELLPALLNALDIKRYILFGHSVGGAMALVAATFDSEGCEAVITESAQVFVDEKTITGLLEAKGRFRDPEQIERLTRWHGEKARWVLQAWTETWLSPQFRQWNLDSVLPQVKCPVLAIHGDSDEYGSEAFPRKIVESVAGTSLLRIIANCGHVPHRTHREEVLLAVTEFLVQLRSEKTEPRCG